MATQLLDALSFPYPSPAPSSPAHSPYDPSSSPAFFASFLASQSISRPASSIPESSPDPLRIASTSKRPSSFALVVERKRQQTPATSESPTGLPRTPTTNGGSPLKHGSRSFSLEIPSPTAAQKRSLFQPRLTESQRARDDTPRAAGGDSGVESPMKRIKLGSATKSGTGRGAVRTGETKGASVLEVRLPFSLTTRVQT